MLSFSSVISQKESRGKLYLQTVHASSCIVPAFKRKLPEVRLFWKGVLSVVYLRASDSCGLFLKLVLDSSLCLCGYGHVPEVTRGVVLEGSHPIQALKVGGRGAKSHIYSHHIQM